MGQKIHPIGFRLSVNKNWSSRWYANSKNFASMLNEDLKVRAYLKRKRLKKPKDQKEAARVFRNLMRAGFGSKTIFTILKKWDVDEETLRA